jgi:hypothetical protein
MSRAETKFPSTFVIAVRGGIKFLHERRLPAVKVNRPGNNRVWQFWDNRACHKCSPRVDLGVSLARLIKPSEMEIPRLELLYQRWSYSQRHEYREEP